MSVLLTTLTGNNANITVGNNTTISGAVIAATDANGNDTGKLNLTTNTLTTENLTDTHYNSATGFSVGANIGLTPATQDPKPDTKDTQTPSGTKINSEHIAFNTSTDTSVGKTLATIGEGTITITDPRHSVLDTESKETLNRDVTKVDKELYSSNTGTKVDATIDNRLFTETGQKEIKNQNKELAGNVINGVALAGNIITGNMDVDNAIKSFQDPIKMADAIKNNPNLAATLDAFTKGQFDNLPKTKEGLQSLADATGLKVDVLLTTVTNYEDAKGTTDKKLVALDVNPENRADIVGTLAHEENHARGGTNETLADMSGYAAQLLSEAAIGGYDQQYLNGIKFELGAGQDSATQAANQVLLGSDNQTYIEAYNDHPLEFYLKGLDDFTNKPLIKVRNGVYNAKDVPTLPDYVNVTAGVGLANGNIAINLYNGEIFYGGGASFPSDGKFSFKKVGVNAAIGYIDSNTKERTSITSEFLGGLSGQTGACAFGGCAGVNVSKDGTTALETGIGTPGISASVGGSSSLKGE